MSPKQLNIEIISNSDAINLKNWCNSDTELKLTFTPSKQNLLNKNKQIRMNSMQENELKDSNKCHIHL